MIKATNSNIISKKNNFKLNRCQSYNIGEETQYFLNRVKGKGCRLTKQRQTLVKQIVELQKPFSAEDLHAKLKEVSIDLATVYRSLLLFADMGLIQSVDFLDGTLRYEYLPQKNSHHHHHIICTQCKKVEPIEMCLVQEQEKQIQKMGYSNVSHKLVFFGDCTHCKSTEN